MSSPCDKMFLYYMLFKIEGFSLRGTFLRVRKSRKVVGAVRLEG